jgi:nucleoside-diphosphate-sugar epimerase
MSKYIAVIAGATGAAAKRLVEVLLADRDWTVVGLCRNPPATRRERLSYVACDLTDTAGTRAALACVPQATHLFYTARVPFSDATAGVEDVAGNRAMLANLLDGAEAAAPGLEHVHLVEGTKWYGMHLGAMRLPCREDDPRHMPPNFYYDQQDLLSARAEGKRWTWSASRPGFLYDFAPERPRNLVPLIGAWAGMCAQMGLPLDFPGKPACYDVLMEATDASQLARGMKWMATAPAARNQALNVTDGSLFRWSGLWPKIARLYGLECGVPRPLRLGEWMADKGALWDAIVERRGLVARPMAEAVTWGFGDFLWGLEHDVVSSMTKSRLAGFNDTVDTEAAILAHLQHYREARLLP